MELLTRNDLEKELERLHEVDEARLIREGFDPETTEVCWTVYSLLASGELSDFDEDFFFGETAMDAFERIVQFMEDTEYFETGEEVTLYNSAFGTIEDRVIF